MITDVLELELKQTKDELKHSTVSLCFDGTSNIDEVTFTYQNYDTNQ